MKNSLLIILISLLLGGTLLASVSFAKEERNRVENGKPELLLADNEIEDDDTEGNDDSMSTSTNTATSTENDENEVEMIIKNHGKNVSDFVKTLLNVADRNNNIGEQVRIVAREQASSTENVVKAMEKVQTRSKFKTFLIGTDYKNLGAIRSEIAQTNSRLSQLDRDLEKITTSSDKTAIMEKIDSLKEEQTKLESFIKTNEGKFSLFGWFVKLFQ